MASANLLKKFAFFVSALVFTCLFSGQLYAAPPTSELIADAETGRILHGKNINSLRHPASLTKVMTLYLTFMALEQGRLRLDDTLPVSWNAASQQPSRLGLDEGSRIKVRDAIYGLVTESANDAAVVLAEGMGGTVERFAYLMTQQARALGMKRTVYRNANGLHDPEQVTTAFDQAILARAVFYHFPKEYKYFQTRSFTYDGRAHRNHNRLMTRYEGMDGIKTGYIRASGFNLIASAKRDGHRLIGIVFGGRTAKSRDNRMEEIMNYGFERVYAEARAGKKYSALPSTQLTADAADVAPEAPEFPVGADPVAQGDEAEPAAPVAAAPQKKKAATSAVRGNWGVQVGTFTNRAKSLTAIKRARTRAPSHLKNAVAKIVPAKSGKKTLYRARLKGLDEKTARTACASLTGAGKTCVIVPPQG